MLSVLQRNSASPMLTWSDQYENTLDNVFETAKTRGTVDQSINLMLELNSNLNSHTLYDLSYGL